MSFSSTHDPGSLSVSSRSFHDLQSKIRLNAFLYLPWEIGHGTGRGDSGRLISLWSRNVLETDAGLWDLGRLEGSPGTGRRHCVAGECWFRSAPIQGWLDKEWPGQNRWRNIGCSVVENEGFGQEWIAAWCFGKTVAKDTTPHNGLTQCLRKICRYLYEFSTLQFDHTIGWVKL